jgi:DNA polymerase III delta prime subunit
MSRLENLSPIDFEDLCLDIAQVDIGLRFSAFGPGPDKGIDGRHSKGDDATILQSKHYQGSSFNSLLAAARKEVGKVVLLKPKRYLFFTSQSLTPNKKDQLEEVFQSLPVQSGDIWGQEDIEGALRQNPHIEKAHIKLWLSSVGVLERILQSGLEAFTQLTKDDIFEELRVYARNQSFNEAIEKLESEKVLVVSGPPGVGKTTLAKVVSYHYLNDGWRFHAINSLDDGFAKVMDDEPTVFFFDDFLGRIELDRQSLLQKDTSLAMFVKRVRKSKNARFILTTRAHIFEEARRVSDHVDDRRFQLSKYLLDVGTYTRKVKSNILFNHLTVSNLSQEHFASLLEDDWLKKIIDHKNYNPRVISSVSSACVDDIKPNEYPEFILSALEDPQLIWDKPFNSLKIEYQNLLVTLFFGNQFVQDIDSLNAQYLSTHRAVCQFYRQPINPTDFEDALRSLESGFVSISGNHITFVNPSLRDYLKAYLTNQELLTILATSSKRWDWAEHLWKHLRELFGEDDKRLGDFSLCFKQLVEKACEIPTYKRIKNKNYFSLQKYDLSIAERLELVLSWWKSTTDDYFFKAMLDLLESKSLDIVSHIDGPLLPVLYSDIQTAAEEMNVNLTCLSNKVEKMIKRVIEEGVPLGELVQIIESVNEHLIEHQVKHVFEAIDEAIAVELAETDQIISEIDSHSELDEHIDYLRAIGRLTNHDPGDAIDAVQRHIQDLGECGELDYSPSYDISSAHGEEKFTDDDLKSLFSGLVS